MDLRLIRIVERVADRRVKARPVEHGDGPWAYRSGLRDAARAGRNREAGRAEGGAAARAGASRDARAAALAGRARRAAAAWARARDAGAAATTAGCARDALTRDALTRTP